MVKRSVAGVSIVMKAALRIASAPGAESFAVVSCQTSGDTTTFENLLLRSDS